MHALGGGYAFVLCDVILSPWDWYVIHKSDKENVPRPIKLILLFTIIFSLKRIL